MDNIEELINYFYTAYGIEKEWPKTFEVSPALYGKCCQAVFNMVYERQLGENYTDFKIFKVALGKQRAGLMFKNVELIVKES